MKILNLALGIRFLSAISTKGANVAHESGTRFSKEWLIELTWLLACKAVFCWCCLLLRSEIPSGICAKLRTVAVSNN